MSILGFPASFFSEEFAQNGKPGRKTSTTAMKPKSPRKKTTVKKPNK